MRQQHVVADPHQLARHPSKPKPTAAAKSTASTATKIASECSIIRSRQCLHHLRKRRMVSIAKPDRNRELAVRRNIDLAHHRDISIQRLAELPGHLHVRAQILIAVARPHIPARRPAEPAARSHRQRPSRPSTPAGTAFPPHRSTAPNSPPHRHSNAEPAAHKHFIRDNTASSPVTFTFISTTGWCGSLMNSFVTVYRPFGSLPATRTAGALLSMY